MASDVYKTVARCASCAWNGNLFRHKRPLQPFSASGPLNFVAMHILCPLSKTSQSKQYLLNLTDRYSKLTRTIPTSKTNATHASLFLNHWIIPFGIPAYLLTNNDTQFFTKFFPSVRGFPGVEDFTTMAYLLQTKRRAERFNRAILTRFRYYLSDIKRDGDIFMQLLTSA